MERVVHKIRLDLGKMGSQASICVSQGDVKSRKIMFLLYNGSVPYEITDNLKITLSATKPDGTVLYDDASFLINGNVITYLMHEQLTAVAGAVNCELVITDSNGVLYSPKFDVYVQEVLITASDITSTNEFTQLNRLLDSWENPVTNVSYGDDVNASVNLDAENGQVNFDFKLEKLPVNTAPGQVLTVDEYGTKFWTSDALTITVNAVVDEATGEIEASVECDKEWIFTRGSFWTMVIEALEMKRPVYALLNGAISNRTLVVPLKSVLGESYVEFSTVLYLFNTAYMVYILTNADTTVTSVRMNKIEDSDTKLKIVTISGNDTDGYTADMTQAEIQEAVRQGAYVIAKEQGTDVRVWAIVDGAIGSVSSDAATYFRCIYPNGNTLTIDTFIISWNEVARKIEHASLIRPRNYVRGYNNKAAFNINTVTQEVSFSPASAAIIWGDHSRIQITKGTYQASYSNNTIVDLVYSPANKSFSIVDTAKADIAASDYVIMTIYVDESGTIKHIVACDDILEHITITEGTEDYSSTRAYCPPSKQEIADARKDYQGTQHTSLKASLDAQFKLFAQRYRNYVTDYVGKARIDVNTSISTDPISGNTTHSVTVAFNPAQRGVLFGTNSTATIMAVTNGYGSGSKIPKAYYVFNVLWTGSGIAVGDYGTTVITDDTPILFTVYIDGSYNVGTIIACDSILDKIYVNGEKWLKANDGESSDKSFNQNTCSIFQRVVCIGDSATAGHIDYGYDSNGVLTRGIKTRRNERYAWPAFMAKLTGNEFINLGVSGATALSWFGGQNGDYELPQIWVPKEEGYLLDSIVQHNGKKYFSQFYNNTFIPGTIEGGDAWALLADPEINGATFDAENKLIAVSAWWSDDGVEGSFVKTVTNTDTIDAYLIGLGLNDTMLNNGECALPLGTTEDIGNETQTFYGAYSHIIEKAHEVSPMAHIFVQTMHSNMSEERLAYNEAIRYIAQYYRERTESPISVHVLDLYEYGDLYEVDTIVNDKFENGHWSAISYQQFAEILRHIWSEYINNNITAFQDVHLIGGNET